MSPRKPAAKPAPVALSPVCKHGIHLASSCSVCLADPRIAKLTAERDAARGHREMWRRTGWRWREAVEGILKAWDAGGDDLDANVNDAVEQARDAIVLSVDDPPAPPKEGPAPDPRQPSLFGGES